MKKGYQVAIIGSGPSTIFSALALSEAGIKDITIFEKGKDIHKRKRGRGMELLCGWGEREPSVMGSLPSHPKQVGS